MDEGPPIADHVLRPHHITLLIILSTVFKDLAIQKLPKPFALHIHRVLLNEVAEVARPKAHKDLLIELCSGSSADQPECKKIIDEVNTFPSTILSADKMGDFFTGTTSLCGVGRGDEHPKLQRRSIFGFFCRRCQTTFAKLSALAVLRLCQDYQAWCAGDDTAGYFIAEKDELSSDLLLFKTLSDKKTWARPQFYEKWQLAFTTGDEKTAVESLRRYFEQHFHENPDSGFRHHALLELIRLHYIRGEFPAARKLLTEAIDTARTSGDKIVLHHCLSILHRLPCEVPGKRPNLQEIQPDLQPLEVLFDTSKLLNEEFEQPLSSAFHKIFQAIGLYDHWLDMQRMPPAEEPQMAHHAVQSIVWREAGCQKLCAIEEDLVLTFTEIGGGSTTRLIVILNKAHTMAREGRYEESLSFLLLPSVWQGLTIHDYVTWSHQLWHILALRTTRRSQLRMYREFLLPRRPMGQFNPKSYLFDAEGGNMSPITESLYQLLQLRECDQVTSGIDHLLKALWHSEFLCKFNLYRASIIFLADIGLEFGMLKRSRQVLEEIMPQLIDEADLEIRAVACFTFARCIIAAGSSTAEALRESIPFLQMAEADFQTLEIIQSEKDVQYLLSVVYHNLGMVQERDDLARKHSQTEKRHEELQLTTFDPNYQDIFELIAKVGAALASRN